MIENKNKELKHYEVKLREFMQKNMDTLPPNSFEQIEDIISTSTTASVMPAIERGPPRRMASHYKNIQRDNLYYDQIIDT